MYLDWRQIRMRISADNPHLMASLTLAQSGKRWCWCFCFGLEIVVVLMEESVKLGVRVALHLSGYNQSNGTHNPIMHTSSSTVCTWGANTSLDSAPWTTPAPNATKVNVDANVGSNSAYATAICRDSMGWVLQVVTERVDTSDLELAEAEAIWIGLRMVIDRNNDRSIVTRDAKCLIVWINNRVLIPSWRAAQKSTSVTAYCILTLAFAWNSEWGRAMKQLTELVTNAIIYSSFGNWLYESLPSPLIVESC